MQIGLTFSCPITLWNTSLVNYWGVTEESTARRAVAWAKRHGCSFQTLQTSLNLISFFKMNVPSLPPTGTSSWSCRQERESRPFPVVLQHATKADLYCCCLSEGSSALLAGAVIFPGALTWQAPKPCRTRQLLCCFPQRWTQPPGQSGLSSGKWINLFSSLFLLQGKQQLLPSPSPGRSPHRSASQNISNRTENHFFWIFEGDNHQYPASEQRLIQLHWQQVDQKSWSDPNFKLYIMG